MTNLADFDMTTLKTELRGIVTLISVDRRARKPLHQQIYDSFRHRIIRRELRAGELVPSSRYLARELHVSRLPVLNAYSQLLAEGYFESRVGAGTFVATSLPAQHVRFVRRSGGQDRQYVAQNLFARRSDASVPSARSGRDVSARSRSASRTCIHFRWTSGRSSSPVTRAAYK